MIRTIYMRCPRGDQPAQPRLIIQQFGEKKSGADYIVTQCRGPFWWEAVHKVGDDSKNGSAALPKWMTVA